MAAQRGFPDPHERYAALSKAGDPPERLAGVIDFEIFRPGLEATPDRSDGMQGGRPPMDPVPMFRVPVIQGALRSGRMRRRSSGSWPGAPLAGSPAPMTASGCRTGRTIRRLPEAPVRTGAVEKPFARSDVHPGDAGYPAMGGQTVDATIVAVPRQRMTDAGKEIVRGGGHPG